MENKINIAELLKDCPQGMELYSPIFGEVYLDKIRPHLAIVVTTKEPGDFKEEFLYDGRYGMNGECMLFPSKDQRDWSKFPRPFREGDILATDLGSVFFLNTHLNTDKYYGCYVGIGGDGSFHICEPFAYKECCGLATENEKQKLFQAIEKNGYKWDAETKTLEKLIQPIFKAGNKVRHKNNHNVVFSITSLEEDYYVCGASKALWFEDQDKYELVTEKFDINTLKPFESRVLVRDKNTDEWRGHFFSHYYNTSDRPYICIGVEGINEYKQCIPFVGNEHLLGKTDDCDNFYKTWES